MKVIGFMKSNKVYSKGDIVEVSDELEKSLREKRPGMTVNLTPKAISIALFNAFQEWGTYAK